LGSKLKWLQQFPERERELFFRDWKMNQRKGHTKWTSKQAKADMLPSLRLCPRLRSLELGWLAFARFLEAPSQTGSRHHTASRAPLGRESNERLTRLRKWSGAEWSGGWHRGVEACFGRGSKAPTYSQCLYLSSSIQASPNKHPYNIQVSIGSSDTMQTAGLF
jgi:hypothetical protein